MERVSTVIIGGGIAGLTTAYYLKKASISCKILEIKDRVGGAIHTVHDKGYIVEIGPNTVLDSSEYIQEMICDFMLESEKINANDSAKNRYIVRNKKLIAAPMSLGGFLKTPLFSPWGKLRLALEPIIGKSKEEESVASFVSRRLGRDVLNYAVNPFVAGIYAGDPSKLSVRYAFAKLYEIEQKYGSLLKGQISMAKERKASGEPKPQRPAIFTFISGLRILVEKLQEYLVQNIVLQAQVTHIVQQQSSWQITYTKDQQSQEVLADSIVYAGPAHSLQNIQMDGKGCVDFKELGNIYYPPLSVVSMGFKREHIGHSLNGFGMLVPEVEKLQILGTLFPSSLFPRRAPKGNVLLTTFVGGARQPENAGLSTGKITSLILSDLNKLLQIRGRPQFVHHMFWEKAIPQYDLGYGKYREKIQQLETKYPDFYCAGNYCQGVSVPDTVKNGWSVAQKIIERAKS